MTDKQRTIKNPVVLKGKGLHSGLNSEMKFLPAPENHGIVFKRVDLEGQPLVHALVENVTDTSRGTTLAEGEVKVSTIEHTVSALSGLGIDNCLIEINAPEAPILDGSSRLIVEALHKAEIVEQNASRKYLTLKEKFVYKDESKGIEIVAYPDDHLSLDVMINYDSRVLGNQFAKLNSIHDYESEVANCRTFVFLHEIEFLANNNLIKGGDLDNAIVIMDKDMSQEELDHLADLFNKPHVHAKSNGILNNVDLHFNNEPARHKLLDLIGDLSLIGEPLKAKIVATRPGHHANTEFAKILRAHLKREHIKPQAPVYDPNKEPVLNINDIKKLLPHRPPMLLVDKIIEMDEQSIVGIKNVTMNEPFFVGHFPEAPVMPGVLMVEATAQVGGILVLNSVPDPENYLTYFMKMDKVKFKRKVLPGDTLLISAHLIAPIKRGIVQMEAKVFVGENVVMEGEFMAQITKNK